MLEVTPTIRIPLDEFEWSFARSGGPGGQNVNKVASKAVLRWNFDSSPSVPDDVKARFRGRFPSRLTTEGEVVLSSELTRDQGRNREDCLEKLAAMLRLAAIVPEGPSADQAVASGQAPPGRGQTSPIRPQGGSPKPRWRRLNPDRACF